MKHINLTTTRGKAKDTALNTKEKEILLNKLNFKDKIIYILGCEAGLRVTEIAQLRFSWFEKVEINNKIIYSLNIPDQDRDILNKKKLFKTKNREARTTYIFNSELGSYLYAFYESNTNGLQLTRQGIHYKVKSWLKYLPNKIRLHPHSLRATAQNKFKFELQLDDSFIQLCFGWKDIKTVLNHYRTLNKQSGESYLFNKINDI